MSDSPRQRLLFAGLLLFGLSLPLSKSASNATLVALFLGAAIGALYDREFRGDVLRASRQPLTAALALFCAVAYAGIVYTERPADGFSVANKFVSLPAIYFLVAVLLQSGRSEAARDRHAESLLLAFLAGLTALNLLGVLTFLGVIGSAPFALPLSPLGIHHIWFSNINALGLYAAGSFLLYTRPGTSARRRLFLCCFLALSALCILLSTSRTAWLGIAATAVIMAAVAIRSKWAVVLVVLLSALAFTAVYRFVPLVHDRVDLVARDISEYSAGKRTLTSSVGARFMMWRGALLMFKSHPLVGVGTGDYMHTIRELRKVKTKPRLVPKLLLFYNQPHNMYLFTMATNGLVGLTALLYIFYRSLRSAVPVMRSGGSGRLFAFLAVATAVHFMIAGFMDSFFNIQILRYSFAFIMGVCVRSAPNPPVDRSAPCPPP